MLYNIINMRQSIGDSNHNYRDIKDLINTYINLIQTSDYGYDTFNYDKLEKVISKLTYKEQISILNYSLSILAREYPEYEKDWFLNELNKAKIKKILCEKDFCNYPKAFLLFAGAPSMILCK